MRATERYLGCLQDNSFSERVLHVEFSVKPALKQGLVYRVLILLRGALGTRSQGSKRGEQNRIEDEVQV